MNALTCRQQANDARRNRLCNKMRHMNFVSCSGTHVPIGRVTLVRLLPLSTRAPPRLRAVLRRCGYTLLVVVVAIVRFFNFRGS